MKDANHLTLFNDEYSRRCNRGRCPHPERQARQAPLADEIARPRSATIASLPAALTTESFTPPFWMYITCLEASPVRRWSRFSDIPQPFGLLQSNLEKLER